MVLPDGFDTVDELYPVGPFRQLVDMRGAEIAATFACSISTVEPVVAAAAFAP
jgi:hypothetical protein